MVRADIQELAAVAPLKRPLSANAERADALKFYQQEEARDARMHTSSALPSLHVAAAKPQVGSWTFDHTARLAGPDPAGRLPSAGNTADALSHLTNVASAMAQETNSHQKEGFRQEQPKWHGYMPPPPRDNAVAPHSNMGSWAADHTSAAAKKPVVNPQLLLAEHVRDVKVVQQAVLQHEGGKGLAKPATKGSWQLDHAGTAQKPAQVPAAAYTALAANVPFTFKSAVAVGEHAAAATAAAAKVVGTASAVPKPAVKTALKTAVAATAKSAQPVGSWAEDHGLVHKAAPPSPKQKAIAAGILHTAEEKAVESGLRAHEEKL